MESILAEYIRIDSPEKLYAVVESLRDLIRQGLVSQIDKNVLVNQERQCDINDVQKGQPWPDDHIVMTFHETATGLVFRLGCETYHGAGGTFQVIRDPRNSDVL